jgi:hypothetical protein
VTPLFVAALGCVSAALTVVALAGDWIAWMLNSHEDGGYGGPSTYIAFAVTVGVLGTLIAVACFAGARALDRSIRDGAAEDWSAARSYCCFNQTGRDGK